MQGVSSEEMRAAIVELADGCLTMKKATYALSAALKGLVDVTDKAAEVMKEFGIESDKALQED